MAYSNTTEFYSLPQYEITDKAVWQDNTEAYAKIDTALHTNADNLSAANEKIEQNANNISALVQANQATNELAQNANTTANNAAQTAMAVNEELQNLNKWIEAEVTFNNGFASGTGRDVFHCKYNPAIRLATVYGVLKYAQQTGGNVTIGTIMIPNNNTDRTFRNAGLDQIGTPTNRVPALVYINANGNFNFDATPGSTALLLQFMFNY